MPSLLRYWNCSPPIESRMMTPPSPAMEGACRLTRTEIRTRLFRSTRIGGERKLQVWKWGAAYYFQFLREFFLWKKQLGRTWGILDRENDGQRPPERPVEEPLAVGAEQTAA